MVVCTCGKPAVVQNSWTNRNPGRRFFGCPTIGSNCPFLGWLDPPMCPRSVDIIPGLLRRINAFRGVVEELEEQRSKYKKYIIIILEGFGAEPIAEYGAYSKIPKDLRKQILTWLRKQPGYYEMLVGSGSNF
ncbi:zinc finger, GRF-type [Artemisia annua]|uniref:Zinc finger, GRF-type n=1 Tax=Artemisia annua TaxID=35608 RepID=A0A2U1M862_ARTAN|nr:zinc finger, GRF-type [Artemisia annua]